MEEPIKNITPKDYYVIVSLVLIVGLLSAYVAYITQKKDSAPADAPKVVAPPKPEQYTVEVSVGSSTAVSAPFTIPPLTVPLLRSMAELGPPHSWKIYTDVNNSYSFQYPSWDDPNEGRRGRSPWSLPLEDVRANRASKDFGIFVDAPGADDLCELEHAGYKGKYADVYPIYENFGGNRYVTYDYLDVGDTESTGYVRHGKFYEIRKNNHCFTVYMQLYDVGDKFATPQVMFNLDKEKRLVEQMISTLTFVGSSNNPATGDNTIQKAEWGISFLKNSTYKIIENSALTMTLTEPVEQERIAIKYSVDGVVTTEDAKFGPMTFWFNGLGDTWMQSPTSQVSAEKAVPATPVFYTADGLPVFVATGRWLTYVVPLRHDTFLQFNITGSGVTQPLTDLVKSLKRL